MALQMIALSSGFRMVSHLGVSAQRWRGHVLNSNMQSQETMATLTTHARWQSNSFSLQPRSLNSSDNNGGVWFKHHGQTRHPQALRAASTTPPAVNANEREADSRDGSSSVRAGLRFTSVSQERQYLYLCPPPPGKPMLNSVDELHEVDITDVRQLASSLDIDRHGFRLVPFSTALEYDGFSSDEKIKEVYYAEAEEAVKKVTGASRVVVFDHTIRKRLKSLEGQIMDMTKRSSVPQPVDRAHVDYTEKSGPQRLRDFMGDEAEPLLKRRFAIVQLWRPLKGPVIDAPLAVCDASTTTPDDRFPVDLIYKDRVGEIFYVAHSSKQKWYYASRMTTDEALVFKCYDSDRSKTARFTPHSGFRDPSTPPGAEPRESIEIRTLAFFD
eukprot:TRINITY_DN10755_c0_g3_i1.p1 TRINITY_DN10755_c0_g3~~TRINITY_DN10755_c0_g3_i1.p1  ORF type:complete len:384 (-),score=57.20 TRINITY_DN10755_c0_g3_i1:594-1745(-)